MAFVVKANSKKMKCEICKHEIITPTQIQIDTNKSIWICPICLVQCLISGIKERMKKEEN